MNPDLKTNYLLITCDSISPDLIVGRHFGQLASTETVVLFHRLKGRGRILNFHKLQTGPLVLRDQIQIFKAPAKNGSPRTLDGLTESARHRRLAALPPLSSNHHEYDDTDFIEKVKSGLL